MTADTAQRIGETRQVIETPEVADTVDRDPAVLRDNRDMTPA